MKILLIGPQGSGKSTQAKMLGEFLNIPVISTGDIFRNLTQEDSDMGRILKSILTEGRLVDDQTTCKIVKERLSQSDCQQGFIADGYPRTVEQMQIFDPKFDKVFHLDVPEEEVIKRLLARAREDDTEELIKTRLDLYNRQTKPLLDYYLNMGILTEVNGIGSVDDIQQKIREELKK